MTQVFVDPDRRGDRTLADAEEIGAQLRTLQPPTEDIDTLGDPFMLPRYYPERSEQELERFLGSEFARAVFDLEPGRWHGPVLSGYGVHWVYVDSRSEAVPPVFAAVRDRVRVDWDDEKRSEFNDAYYEGLLARYDVTIEDPDAAEDHASLSMDQ